jgi:hypothetical protein
MIVAVYSVFTSHTHTHKQHGRLSGDMTSYCYSQTGYLDFATFPIDFFHYIIILLCIPRDRLAPVNINIEVFLFFFCHVQYDKHKFLAFVASIFKVGYYVDNRFLRSVCACPHRIASQKYVILDMHTYFAFSILLRP